MRHLAIFVVCVLTGLAALPARSAPAVEPIASIEELFGWWTWPEYQGYPFEHCADPDNMERVAIGRTRWNDELGELEFLDRGDVEISFYEGGCTLTGDGMGKANQLVLPADCGSEGEDYSGFATFERIDANTIEVRTPMSDEPVVLAACRPDLSAVPVTRPGGKLPYGSRAGMEVTVLGSWALDTSAARIYFQHSYDDARSFCMQYVMTLDDKCIEDVMEEAKEFNRSVAADCESGEFETVYRQRYRFDGPGTGKGADPMYLIYPAEGGKKLDGSSASGYGVALTTFAMLCPGRVPDRAEIE